MTWAKIDDLMPEHPKIVGLSDGAFRVHISSICWTSRNLTDGHIPDASLPILGATPDRIRELSRANLWHREKRRGWVIHDYLSYNRSRAQVLEEREDARERMRLSRRSSDEQKPKFGRSSTVEVEVEELSKIGRSVKELDPSSVRPSMREPDASLEPPAATDVASQSSPPTDRSPPPAVQDGGVHDESCPCGGGFGEKCRQWATGSARKGPPFISEPTRQAIADLLGYPVAGKKITRMFTGQVEWCAGATEAHWLELIKRATNGKNAADVQPDGSAKEGWVKTTLTSIRKGGA